MKKSETGLSLMEVLFALGILSLVLLAIGSGFSNMTSKNVNLRNQTFAMEDSRQIIEQIRKVADEQSLNTVRDSNYWTRADGQGWLQTTTSLSHLPQVTRTVTFPDGTADDPLRGRVSVQWLEKGITHTYSLETLVTKRT